MENNNWEPKVGQKIIALVDGDALPKPVKKGDVFTVLAVRKMCCAWHVDVGLLSPKTVKMICKFHGTPMNLVRGECLWPESRVFAPINPYSNSISLELANKAMEERVEVDGPVREVVNN